MVRNIQFMWVYFLMKRNKRSSFLILLVLTLHIVLNFKSFSAESRSSFSASFTTKHAPPNPHSHALAAHHYILPNVLVTACNKSTVPNPRHRMIRRVNRPPALSIFRAFASSLPSRPEKDLSIINVVGCSASYGKMFGGNVWILENKMRGWKR